MSRVIAITNHKGGVGKTTTAVNLGASLAIAEKRTLVIDLDPQSNATRGLGVGEQAAKSSIYGVLLDMDPIGRAIVRSVHLPLLDVIPATPDLAGAEIEMLTLPRAAMRLKDALAPLRDVYDYVLLDCPPAMGVLTLNALAAADSVVIPLQPEFFALEGFTQLIGTLNDVTETVNPRLDVEGVLFTLFDRRLSLARQVEEELRRSEYRVFDTVIPRNVTLAEAPGHEKPVALYDITSPGTRAYLALAREVAGQNGTAAPQLVAI